MKKIKLGFIGVGNMAGAIIGGVVRSGVLASNEIMIYDIDPGQTKRLGEDGCLIAGDIPELVRSCATVVLSVKPQIFGKIMPLVKEGISRETVLVSIAAGITAEYLRAQVGFDCKLVLVMPNTPLLVGHGATALCRIEPTTAEEFQFVRGLFQSAGIAEEIPADKMKEIIPVNGSSPAFIYRFVKVVAETADAAGIDYDIALKLLCQTMIGSAHMLMESGKSAKQLIDMVCSPGGTTLAAMDALTTAGFDSGLEKAFSACVQRAVELSGGK